MHKIVLALLFLSILSCQVFAAEGGTKNEKKISQKFFSKKAVDNNDSSADPVSSEDHYLTLHLGGFMSSDSYKWGDTPHVENVGKLNIGVGYKLGPLGEFADWLIQIDFNSYELPEGRPVQMIVSPRLSFPDATSKFPLYFGGSLGAGIFFKQINQESMASLNYSLFGGARLFNVVGNTGFFLEGGLKNSFFLLSDGQVNGYFITVGTVFVF